MAPPEGIHIRVGYNSARVEISQALPHQTALLIAEPIHAIGGRDLLEDMRRIALLILREILDLLDRIFERFDHRDTIAERQTKKNARGLNSPMPERARFLRKASYFHRHFDFRSRMISRAAL